jgi:hypothetical protein
MKIHSVRGLKDKAQHGYMEIVSGTVAHKVRGVTVQVEKTLISCLYDPSAHSFAWYMDGVPVTEQSVCVVLEPDYKPPREVSTEESLAKFDTWHTAQLPVVSTYVATEGREKCETLIRLGEQWGTLYNGPEGYLKIEQALGKNIDEGRRSFLHEKLDNAERSLLEIAEKFVAEYQRLELTVIPAREAA